MCLDAGIELVYLARYSPDLDSIEEPFAELKYLNKRNWNEYENNPQQDFAVFLEWCIAIVGGRERKTKAHFGHAGITVEAF